MSCRIIDVIAPSGSFPIQDLSKIKAYIESKGFTARIPEHILGNDLLCANCDSERSLQLITALLAEDSDLIWCVRGGYGAARLIPDLLTLPAPKKKKTLIGFSDITALHLFLHQHWGWTSLHGPSLRQMAEPDLGEISIRLTEDLFFGTKKSLDYPLIPMNSAAEGSLTIQADLSGGNLKLVESSRATPWQIDAQNKILLLEEVNEYAYRVDRSLVHLTQAQIFQQVKALIFGDFTHELSAHEAKIEAVLMRFATQFQKPVFRISGVGHGRENLPWFYAKAEINAGRLHQHKTYGYNKP